MKRFFRTTLLLAAITAISTGPALASQCAQFVWGYYGGDLAVGELIGTKTITLTAGLSAYFQASVSEQFCVGVYKMETRNGHTFNLDIRCDNYSLWGVF